MCLLLSVLVGCTASAPGGPGAPVGADGKDRPAASSAPADSPLRPVYPDDFSAGSAGIETARIADAVQALLPPSDIVNVDDHAQEVPADKEGAGYYGVIRTITLTATVDPVTRARAITSELLSAGWVERQTADEPGSYFAALSSEATGTESWFIVIGGDTSVPGQSVVTLQLASPELS